MPTRTSDELANKENKKKQAKYKSYTPSNAVEQIINFIICIWKNTHTHTYRETRAEQKKMKKKKKQKHSHPTNKADLPMQRVCNWHKNEIIRIINLRRIFLGSLNSIFFTDFIIYFFPLKLNKYSFFFQCCSFKTKNIFALTLTENVSNYIWIVMCGSGAVGRWFSAFRCCF